MRELIKRLLRGPHKVEIAGVAFPLHAVLVVSYALARGTGMTLPQAHKMLVGAVRLAVEEHREREITNAYDPFI